MSSLLDTYFEAFGLDPLFHWFSQEVCYRRHANCDQVVTLALLSRVDKEKEPIEQDAFDNLVNVERIRVTLPRVAIGSYLGVEPAINAIVAIGSVAYVVESIASQTEHTFVAHCVRKPPHNRQRRNIRR